jgi:AcrR family transcriptional regulator
MAKSARTERRKPRQARARGTCDAIFEAAAQILEREGERAFNTNRLAERAGVSVGTIYQYFPDKEAILVAMSRAEQQRIAAENVRIAARPLSHNDMLRTSLRRFIRAFDGLPSTRRAVVKAVIAREAAETLGREIDRAAYLLPAKHGMSRLDAFVVTRAVVGAVRAAVLEGYSGLNTPAFEDALIRLVRGYQKAGSGQRRAAAT